MATATASSDTATTLQNAINKYFPYLVEIRRRLMFIASIFLVAAAVGFLYYEKIILFVFRFLDLEGVNIVFTTPFQFFTLSINSGVFLGTIVVFPLLIYQLIAFLKPALSKKEHRLLLFCLPFSVLLLIAGFAYGIYIMKYIVVIFYQKSQELQIGNVLDIELLLSKVILTSLLMSLAFQFPIVMSILIHLKTVALKTFSARRPLAYMASLIFVMFLPPTDILSDVLLVAPLIFLFEGTLFFHKFIIK